MEKTRTKELRNKSTLELKEGLVTLNYNLSISYGVMQQENAKRDMRNIKKNIARIKTILNERKIRNEE